MGLILNPADFFLAYKNIIPVPAMGYMCIYVGHL
jgi:hypothetical protein